MADSDLGTRVHSQVDGTDGRVQSKVVGADSATLGAAAAFQQKVDSDGNAHAQAQGNDPAGTDRALRLSEQGAITPDGVYDASNNTDPGNVGLVAMSQSGSPADSQQTLRLTAISAVAGAVRALDIALRDEAGLPFTADNPLPVTLAESEGTEVHDYDNATALASLASANHDRTVGIGLTEYVHKVICGASGDAKYELQIEDAVTPATFATVAVKYSSNSKDCDIILSKAVKVVSGATSRKIRVVKTNLDDKVQDVHSTIVGIA